MNADKPIILVDGSSYLYRAFHAMPSLSNSQAQPTGAIYGVINMLRRLLAEHDPDCIAVVFDAKGKTFRHEMYHEYKAHRPPMPEELAAQIRPLHEIIRAMGLPLLEVSGVEADDVIGTLAAMADAAGRATLISSGDKDLAQLVTPHVLWANTMTDEHLDADAVQAKFGVPPPHMIDYLALVGDSADNIPGVPKVGPKTATKWLLQYGSLDALIAHKDEIKGKIGDNLRASLETLALSRKLAAIRCDLDLGLSLSDLQRQKPDAQALRHLFQQYEFKTWLAEVIDVIDGDAAPGDADRIDAPVTHYECVTDMAALDQWLSTLQQAPGFAFDTETTSLDYMQAEIVGVSFCCEAGRAAYVPLAHDYDGAPTQLSRDSVLAKLRPLLEDPARPKIGQNLKYDMSVLANYGIALDGIYADTMLESYVLDSTATRHDMDSLALKYLGLKTIHFEDVAGKGAKQITFNAVPIEQAVPYAAEDADITFRLHELLWPRLAQTEALMNLLRDIEVPLIPVLSRIERNGVLVDGERLQRQSIELGQRLEILQAQAWDLAGGDFNLGSPKQLQTILFEQMGLPVKQKTPKGQPSTNEAVLQELADEGHELPILLLEHRSLSKLKSTYTDKLPDQVNARTGRVHTSYHQAVAATGRLSSSDPNLQNIPIRTAEGRRIRQAFVAPAGRVMLSADYSQIELRIMAHLSGDKGLLEAFARGEDVHRATAAEVFGTTPMAVTDVQRRHAKAINFGLIYGMSAFGLARQLGIDRGSAADYMEIYFQRYPGVKKYMDETRESARKQGYVETLYGRRLYLPDIKASNVQRRQYAERTAINAPMQGSAADIIKRAMLNCHRWLQEQSLHTLMVLQVHDELVFEVPDHELAAVRKGVERCMASAAQLRVPLVVDMGTGPNWDEAH